MARQTIIERLEDRTLLSTYLVSTGEDASGGVKRMLHGFYFAKTLRDAVTAANASPDSDLILINPRLHGPIVLAPGSGEITISNPLTLSGFGADRQSVVGGGASRVFNIAAGIEVTINNLTITGGQVTGAGGGAIRNAGKLSMHHVAITHNSTDADGAGVFNSGTLLIQDSTVSGNDAGSSGGGLFNAGNAKLINVTIAGNIADFGGAVYNLDMHQILISNCTISQNVAHTSGGGIAATLNDPINTTSGTRLNNSIVAGNTREKTGAIGPDLYGFFDSASTNNLIGSLGFAKGLDGSKNLLGSVENKTAAIDANLMALQNYGSPTATMPPMQDSSAIDGGSNALIEEGVTRDQRGRARINGASVDIGSVESGKDKKLKHGKHDKHHKHGSWRRWLIDELFSHRWGS